MTNQDIMDVMTKSITSFELIHRTSKGEARLVVEYGVDVQVVIQDDCQTMKVFLTDRKQDEDGKA